MTRQLIGIVVTAAAAAAAACTQSSASIAAPTAERCGVSASAFPATFTASGGTGTLTISGARDCTWTAATDAGWLEIEGETRGQGEAALSYRVTPNSTPVARRGAVQVEGVRVDIAQEGAPCRFDLDRRTVGFGSAGGTATLRVAAMSGCTWTAASGLPWVSISQGASGNGPGEVVLSAAANPGAARSGQVTVAGSSVDVTQEALPVVPPPAPPAPAPPSPPPGPPAAPTPPPAPPAPAPPSPPPPPPAPTPPAPTPPPPPPAPPPPGPVPVDDDVELEGEISQLSGSCPSLTFALSGRTVWTDHNTEFSRGQCRDLRRGDEVEVDGIRFSDGRVYAKRVKLERDDDRDILAPDAGAAAPRQW